MRVIKAVVAIVVVLVIAVALYDGIQPSLAEKDARSAAAAVAKAAAQKLLTERDAAKTFDAKSADAFNAASAVARTDSVTLTSFKIDPTTNTVHVRVVKTAKSIVIKHIQALRHLDEITVSATAAPG